MNQYLRLKKNSDQTTVPTNLLSAASSILKKHQYKLRVSFLCCALPAPSPYIDVAGNVIKLLLKIQNGQRPTLNSQVAEVEHVEVETEQSVRANKITLIPTQTRVV